MTFIRLSLSVLFHPAETFRTIQRYRDRSVYPAVLLILGLVVLVRFGSLYLVHFPLSALAVEDANLFLEAARFLIPILSWVTALYAVTSILRGESHPREVLLSTAYCMLPYVVFQLPLALASRGLGTQEGLLYGALEVALAAWVGILFLMSIRILNHYDLGQTLRVTFVSLFAMLVLWAVLTLVFSLSSQFVVFLLGILREIRMNLQA